MKDRMCFLCSIVWIFELIQICLMCRTRWFSGVVISSNPLKEVRPIVCKKKNIYIYLNVSDYIKWGLNLIFNVVTWRKRARKWICLMAKTLIFYLHKGIKKNIHVINVGGINSMSFLHLTMWIIKNSRLSH